MLAAGISFASYSTALGANSSATANMSATSTMHNNIHPSYFNGTLVVRTGANTSSSAGPLGNVSANPGAGSVLSITASSPQPERAQASAALNAQLVQTNKSIMTRAAAQVNCKTNFTIEYIENVSQEVPNASVELNQSIETLRQDNAQLYAYAAAGNSSQVRAYITGTYNPEVTSIRVQLRSILNGNVSNAQKLQLVQSYKRVDVKDGQCEYNVLKQFASDKLSDYQTILSTYTLQAINLSAKGLDTANLQADIANANSTILIPFSNAINSSTNATQLENAINTYCLFDGCSSGINDHLAAHFSYDKLVAIVNKIDTYNLSANQTAEISAANGYLSAANSALVQVNTSHYRNSQEAQVWTNLRNASVSIKLALKQV